MNKEIAKIIKAGSFQIQSGKYIYTKVTEFPNSGNHFMISKDNNEITVVTKEENLNKLSLLEKNKDFYTLISLNVSIPFYSVGFLATVSGAIAKYGMNILIVSTYSKDYILVKANSKDKAREILLELGFKESK